MPSSVVTVGTSAALAALAQRKDGEGLDVLLEPLSGSVFVGARSDVTTSTGRQLTAPELRHIRRNEAVHLIAAAAGAQVRVTTAPFGSLAQPTGGGPRGVWNSGTDYVKGDIVSYLTGSYMAIATTISAGGQSPAVSSSWLQLASGGGEIAGPAELAANFVVPLQAGVLHDVTGMSLPIPAGSPRYEVEAEAPMVQFVFAAGSAAGNLATLRLLLVDEGNVALAQSIVRVTTAAAGAVTQWQQSRVSRKMAAAAAAKTVKLCAWLDTVANITSVTLWAGAGSGTPPGTATLGPASLVARAR